MVTQTVERIFTELEFVTMIEYDEEYPDLSWLDQTDDEMGEGWEDHAQERKEAYDRGEWHMVGVIVQAILTDVDGRTEEFQQALWGIESDSDKSYFSEVAQELTTELKFDLMKYGIDYSFMEEVATYHKQ